VNIAETKLCVHVSSPTTEQSHETQLTNKSLETALKLKYLGTTVTTQNCTPEGMKSGPHVGNVCSHSIHNILSSNLLPKNFRSYNLSVVLYDCETGLSN
jgi:hypothetical protein